MLQLLLSHNSTYRSTTLITAQLSFFLFHSTLYDELANNPFPVVLLSTVPKYADHFISTAGEEPNLPPLLSSLRIL